MIFVENVSPAAAPFVTCSVQYGVDVVFQRHVDVISQRCVLPSSRSGRSSIAGGPGRCRA